jgi:hypothetical protein
MWILFAWPALCLTAGVYAGWRLGLRRRAVWRVVATCLLIAMFPVGAVVSSVAAVVGAVVGAMLGTAARWRREREEEEPARSDSSDGHRLALTSDALEVEPIRVRLKFVALVAVHLAVVWWALMSWGNSDTPKGPTGFEWRWLPVVLLPEAVAVVGLSFQRLAEWYRGREGRNVLTVSVFFLAFLTALSFPWIASATSYAVMRGVPR